MTRASLGWIARTSDCWRRLFINSFELKIVSDSLEPVFQCSLRSLPELALEAALAAQSE
jgi:hypothetical protein